MSAHVSRRVREVDVHELDAARLESLIGRTRMARFEAVAEAAQAALDGRVVFNINSTATGGGVAEMLQTLLAYARGAGVDARWLVIEGDPEFFAITKRIHNGLYGFPGDGGELGEAEREHYEEVLAGHAEDLADLIKPGDVVLVHDPQPAGLTGTLIALGASVLWRCHVGVDRPNHWSERAWNFLRPYLEGVHSHVFSRRQFAPSWLPPGEIHVIPPSIDPFSAKNEPISRRNVRLALSYIGLLDGDGSPPAAPFTRRDGSPGRITRRADVLQSGPAALPGAPLVVQVSRWDKMKDMAGVMEGFARYVDPGLGAHLILAGPAATGVADDPEATAVFDECVERWHALPDPVRARVHLTCLPMADPDENAAMTNALQRHASVVVQKSLAEGFGLTVAEAMWKSRPIVASAVGGIQDQISDGEQGILIEDPADLEAFGAALERLLRDPALAARMGKAGRRRAEREFLGDRHLEQYGRLFARARPRTAAHH